MEYRVLKTCAGGGLVLHRGFEGDIKASKEVITDLLNAGYIEPIKPEKRNAKLKGKKTL